MLSAFRARLTYANVAASVALFIALGGTSYGLATGSIGSREIKNNAVRSSDIRDGGVRSRDVRNRSLLARDFKPGQLRAGPRGPAGQQGSTGPRGATGAQGPPGVISSASRLGGPGIPNPDGTRRFLALPVTVTLPAGAKVWVSSHRAFGTAGATAGSLNLFMCHRVSGSGATPTQYGNGLAGMQLPANTKSTLGFSLVLENLAPGTYEVGLCGTGGSGWTNNDWGSTTALVLR